MQAFSPWIGLALLCPYRHPCPQPPCRASPSHMHTQQQLPPRCPSLPASGSQHPYLHNGRQGASGAGAVVTQDELPWELLVCVGEAAG